MKGGGRPWPHLEATPFEVRGANGNPRTENPKPETRNGGGDPKSHARAQMAAVG